VTSARSRGSSHTATLRTKIQNRGRPRGEHPRLMEQFERIRSAETPPDDAAVVELLAD
jgi:hypothetical protein